MHHFGAVALKKLPIHLVSHMRGNGLQILHMVCGEYLCGLIDDQTENCHRHHIKDEQHEWDFLDKTDITQHILSLHKRQSKV